MSHKRRQYPQAQYNVAAQPPAASQASLQPAYGGAVPGYPQDNGANGVPQPGAAGQQGFFTPGASNGYQQPESVDAAAHGIANMNLGGVPQASPYGAQAPIQPGYGGVPQQHTPSYGAPVGGAYGAQPQAPYGAASPFESRQQTLPLNQLYQTDLMRDIPPPITDLSLPPPPLIIPPSATTIPSCTTATVSPDYFRSTLNAVPTSNNLLKKSKLPFALVVRPYTSLKDDVRPLPVVEDTVISRCRRCRTYINCFVEFTEQGRRWKCNLCSLQNDVPAAFDNSPEKGPVNRYDRRELNYSVVEFVAPQEYMVRPPQPLVLSFVIDVSVNAVKTGMLATVATTILESLDRIPNPDGRTKIAIIGVDSALHYIKIPDDSEEGEAEILVVPDLDEPFSPSPESLLINLANSRKNIEKLLSNLNNLFLQNLNPKLALGPALKAAHYLVQSVGSKIIAFASILPNHGVGKLVVRDENAVSDKPKEASALMTPNDSFYKSFAVDCNKSQVTVDFFLTGNGYMDVATLANLPRYTAGQTHFYPGWSANNFEDVTRFGKELSNVMSQDIALEAVLRTRGSSGLRMNTFYGNFFNRSSDLCSFPTFPRDQSYVIEVAIEENITKPLVYLQTAVLHTTISGQRRIRVITAAIPTTNSMSEVFASADQLAITNYYTHKALEKVYSNTFEDARELLSKYLFELLNVFKKEVVAGNMGGASPLMLSTNLRMLPLLLHSLTKHMAFRPGKVPADHRANALNLLGSLPLPQLIKYIYPTVYSLHDMSDEVGFPDEETGEIVMPTPINASAERFERYGLYLIDNTTELFLWIGGDAVPDLVNDVYGIPDIFQVPVGKMELPELETNFNVRVRNIISKAREGDDRSMYQNLYIVRGGSANEPLNAPNSREVGSLRMWAASSLVEDRLGKQPSYREFLSTAQSKMTN
ncbi:CYFA0S07e02586g1_1 [Cyberlindnera fabianii]|uniref:CYFA0S07e02586g1_1 n=1 Tax=Cyberlindnera fabianii TaxID=36022 RepID=A0A061AV38_CYBFA|nr:Protein transport protein SEC24 [Cyberlindnera fabianii]CDR41474.1 CYFA0S07e02586g1_1 [Cyberlindnera fabianii]